MKKYFLTIKRLWALLKDFQKHFYVQFILIILDQAIAIFVTLSIAKILDSLISKNIKFTYLFILVYAVLVFIRNRISLFATLRKTRYLDNNIQQFLEEYSFKNIFNLNISQYTDDHSAVKLQVIDRGESATQQILELFIFTVFPTITQILFATIAIGYYSPLVAIWCLLIIIIVTWWANRFSEAQRPFLRQNISNWDKQKKVRTESFQHLPLIKLFSAENSFLKKYLENRKKVIEYSINLFNKGAKNGHYRGLFTQLSRVVTLLIVVRQFFIGILTTGSLYAIWSWMNDIYNNIQSIVRSMNQIPLRFVELEKYLDIIDKKPDFVEGGNIKFKNGDIVLKNVSLGYKNSETLSLDNISLTINAGEKVALVGQSGGGKTSLVKLIMRAYDYTSGSIKIGNIELRDFDHKSLRSHIGYVEQHVDLFDTSIKDNMLLGIDKEVPDKKINEAAEKARITEFYHRLGEKGLDTEIGERGIKLSGGERQRVGIARALIRNPEILIFDEATSALDTENESYIKEAIDEASKGRTTIIIAHRLSTVRDADKIIVMDKGTIVAEGTHEELLKNSKHYQTLVEHQLS